ncbi:MAG: 50S ribosomal protein L11 methyltransferase [Acidobacteria bacterium]|nr:50S ribosomal protein L11 methyltransferase [Acidobacteriota bacterium]
MDRNFVEVVIEAEMDAGEFLGMLAEDKFLGSWEEEGLLHVYWPGDRWDPGVLEDLKRVLKNLGTGNAGLSVRSIGDRDWNAAWAASLAPLRLGRNVRIRQSWHAPDPSFGGFELVIDPKRAFGTGHHATTRLVIEWLEDRIRGGERILDVGAGSGILSMVAIRLGAASALGLDTDPVAVDCAREYAEANGFGREPVFRVGSFENPVSEPFDVVLANIDGRTLPALSGFLPRLLKEDGIACYSGLQQQDLQEVQSALAKAGFRILARMQREEWFALEIRKLRKIRRGGAECAERRSEIIY